MSVSARRPLLRNGSDAAPLNVPLADILYSFANVQPEVSTPALIAFLVSESGASELLNLRTDRRGLPDG